MFLAFLAQSILHALVAALFVEGLLRAWRIEDGAWRLRFRFLALTVPLAWVPAFFLLAPARNSAQFVAYRALFASERWNQVRLGGAGLGDFALILAAGAGSALFLRDAVPPLLDLLHGSSRMPDAGPWHASADALRAMADRHAARLRMPAPGIRVVRAAMPVLLCEGAIRPGLVVSTAALERLQGSDLEAAVAHELAHAEHRDPAWGYLLIAVRAVLFFNPAAQWVARAMVDDIERRADQVAVKATGNAAGLARAIGLLFDAVHPPPVDGDASFERVFWRVRREGVERRCARLRELPGAAAFGQGPLLMALAAIGILGLVFFVV